ncbi:putative leucine-rich repeat receptor-like serine/threonine-protein kinase [Arachis hypogaea]|nr:putative leucine-rich repeat receptor-like serine/threonine-protein kinase [Arachis hypogaea]
MLTSVMGHASMAIDEKIYGLYRVLKSQNSSGTLPPQLARLPYLQEIDLTFNYLNGTIPKQWSSLNLVNIRLGDNQFSGSIPNFIQNWKSVETV